MVQLALKYMAIKTVVRSGAGRSGWSGQALRLRVRRPDVRAEVGDGGTRLPRPPGKRGRVPVERVTSNRVISRY